MRDWDIIEAIKRKAPGVAYVIEDDTCVELRLTGPSSSYHGLIRHASDADKWEILNLVSKLRQLRHLDLRKNKLKRLPDALGELVDLEFLDLASNYLGKVPPWIERMKRLQYLNL